MKRIIIMIVCLLGFGIVSNAQMPTDNSYLRKNYEQSKTYKKRAAKKAARKARKGKTKTISNAGTNTGTAGAQKGISQNIQSQSPTPPAATNITANGNDNNRWDSQEPYYLAGALTTDQKDKVVFDKQITLTSGITQERAMQAVMSVVGEVIAHTEDTKISRIDSADNHSVKAVLCEPIYFKQKKWVTDSTLIRYTFEASVKDGALMMHAYKINYSYESGSALVFDYPAEEWITDEYALTKDKKATTKNAGKFRVKTIDYFRDFYARVAKRMETDE